MAKGFVIAIDGPAGAGKSTISTILAKKLNGYHLYTGSMYRAVALYCLENSIPIANEQKVLAVLPKIIIDFKDGAVCLNGKNMVERIKERDVDQAVPTISDYQEVRDEMRKQQKLIAEKKVQEGFIVIADGRDMGTVVFPNAEVKIYLTAKPEVRAKRRMFQQQKLRMKVTFEEVLKDTKERDERDMHGKLHYLADNPKELGYTIIDDSNETQEQTINDIIAILKERNLLHD